MNLFLSAPMKSALFALLTIAFVGCTNTTYTHRKDFERTKPKGAWNDYNNAVSEGRQPEEPKVKK
jgi:hypothetical protein